MILCIDDILLASSDLGLLHKTKKFLSKNFEMQDTGEATYVIRNRNISRLIMLFIRVVLKTIY
jgi:hypothetical protein